MLAEYFSKLPMQLWLSSNHTKPYIPFAFLGYIPPPHPPHHHLVIIMQAVVKTSVSERNDGFICGSIFP